MYTDLPCLFTRHWVITHQFSDMHGPTCRMYLYASPPPPPQYINDMYTDI